MNSRTSTLQGLLTRLGLADDAVTPYGRQIVKIDPERVVGAARGRVVLMTAITPTPAGEGKTTTAIGLVDGLCRLGVSAIGALREPSVGPVFGRKGGAVGGGQATVEPADRINLHFTGDLHAITSAHNLLSAMIDNHMYFDHAPHLDPDTVSWGRALDLNDRALRKVEVGGGTSKGPLRHDRFDITAASEVMAIVCMARDIQDLKLRLSRIVVGRTADGAIVTADDIKATGAMTALLLDAMNPNLVATREGNPVLVHGGPFANIAQGTSSLRQTLLARRLADVVVTEGGFAFDLGGFKFLDLQCRVADIRPAAVVLVVTVRALRHHGGVDFKLGPDVDAVRRGLDNAVAHMEAMQRLGLEAPIVAVNRFPDDSTEELALIKAALLSRGATVVEASHFAHGGKGAEELARAVVKQLDTQPHDSPALTLPYELDDSLMTKLERMARVVLGATDVELSEQAHAQLTAIEASGYGALPICLAKTHLSISDDPKILARPATFTLHVSGLRVSAGAGFIVVLCGSILTMPGLPSAPSAWNVNVERDHNGTYRVTGLA